MNNTDSWSNATTVQIHGHMNHCVGLCYSRSDSAWEQIVFTLEGAGAANMIMFQIYSSIAQAMEAIAHAMETCVTALRVFGHPS